MMPASNQSLGQRRLVHGVGVNDANYNVHGKEGRCPFYTKWYDMLKRCYSSRFHKQYSSYIGCSVSPEWCYFSKFRLWMENQKWEGLELDKDILVKGNQVYSPDTCCFIPQAINVLFSTGRKRKHNLHLPEGVKLCNNGKYRVQLRIRPGVTYCKTLPSFKEACRCALEKKIEAVRYAAHDPRLEVKVILALGGHIHEMQETIKSI